MWKTIEYCIVLCQSLLLIFIYQRDFFFHSKHLPNSLVLFYFLKININTSFVLNNIIITRLFEKRITFIMHQLVLLLLVLRSTTTYLYYYFPCMEAPSSDCLSAPVWVFIKLREFIITSFLNTFLKRITFLILSS